MIDLPITVRVAGQAEEIQRRIGLHRIESQVKLESSPQDLMTAA